MKVKSEYSHFPCSGLHAHIWTNWQWISSRSENSFPSISWSGRLCAQCATICILHLRGARYTCNADSLDLAMATFLMFEAFNAIETICEICPISPVPTLRVHRELLEHVQYFPRWCFLYCLLSMEFRMSVILWEHVRARHFIIVSHLHTASRSDVAQNAIDFNRNAHSIVAHPPAPYTPLTVLCIHVSPCGWMGGWMACCGWLTAERGIGGNLLCEQEHFTIHLRSFKQTTASRKEKKEKIQVEIKWNENSCKNVWRNIHKWQTSSSGSCSESCCGKGLQDVKSYQQQAEAKEEYL